ncbi:hypothetical protein [Brevibacillus laterosporus]|uniref:Uncharacterized protein n=1 Tax=Brevibacillus laterosporus TaxID=1465 RepID=A0AAP8QFC3_BRELA|nr:hypothetical protein [Brevibacillus laterosporus]PPB10673.1 hypothetical protein C4A77_05775 [Brevibacillus laterosporus]
MAVIDDGKGNLGNTNATLRKEIKNDIINQIQDISEVKRTDDSIKTSPNFHLDSKYLKDEHQYKVEIQYKNPQPGQGKATISLVLVNEKATSVKDLREALELSLKDGHKYKVT